MRPKIFLVLLLTALFLSFSLDSYAEMTSGSYRIHRSVLSGGAVFSDSANYQAKGTLGQPSPLIEHGDPPFSDSYDLYPGFWFTIAYSGIPKKVIISPFILLLLNE
jgi:hypothetical protein